MTSPIANGPACDFDGCGQPTYEFASGSIWCPNEDPHPGGHFVKRVAFERIPVTQDDINRAMAPRRSGGYGARSTMEAKHLIEKRGPVHRPSTPKVENPFAVGMDTFIEKGAR